MKAPAAALLAALPAVHAAHAQNYPNRPVRLLVPLTPGGGADIIARVVSQKLTETLGQQFVVDNRPGAGGSVAYDLAARAAADGHTLAFSSSTFVINQLLYKARLSAEGAEAVGNTPAVFALRLKAEFEKWAKTIHAAGIKVE